MTRPSVRLAFRDDARPPLHRRSVAFDGGAAELVEIEGPCAFDYDRSGARHYMAVHDIVLADGEMSHRGVSTPTPRDLRGRLSFIPARAHVSGWSSMAARRNSYTALTYDPDLIENETERPRAAAPRRLQFFSDAPLFSTLRKIEIALRQPEADLLLIETLSLLAAVEMDRFQARIATTQDIAPGRLSPERERLLFEFIERNIDRPITLAELAALAGLSRFHFSRMFKASFGVSPSRHLVDRRIERAKTLLRGGRLPIAAIGRAVGYNDPARFAAVFKALVGCAPSEFRRKAA